MNVAASRVKSALAGFREEVSEQTRKAQTNFTRVKYAAQFHVLGLFSQPRAKAIAKKANAHGAKAYRNAKGITAAAVPTYESTKFAQDAASAGGTTRSSQGNRIKALEGCVEFIAAEKKAMTKRDDVIAEKGVVHVIAKSIDRVSGQIEVSGANLSEDDQRTLDASLTEALSKFASCAHEAICQSSLSNYDEALKDLHFAMTLASMRRE
jgi:hypothetical protein